MQERRMRPGPLRSRPFLLFLTIFQLFPDRFLEIIGRWRSPALFHSFAISGRARWRDTELLRVGLDFVEWLRADALNL